MPCSRLVGQLVC